MVADEAVSSGGEDEAGDDEEGEGEGETGRVGGESKAGCEGGE